MESSKIEEKIMEQLTPRQEEYLLLFATLNGNERFISDAATYFQVSKPTVSSIITALIKHGVLQKTNWGELALTKSGESYIAKKLGQWSKLSDWLREELGLTPLQAEKDARCMVSTLPQATIEAMLTVCTEHKKPQFRSDEHEAELLSREVPFNLYKKDGITLSMGNKGFEKPAVLHRQNGNLWIELHAMQIKYNHKKRLRLQGKLERFWYNSDGKWLEVAEGENGVYCVPFTAVSHHTGDDCATLTIRARATVGIFTMPESEANIVFDLSECDLI